MTTQNIEQHSECTYKALKNRLRILLNDLEARCEVKGCAEDKSESENVTKLEVNNRDCSKQSKKIELLHDDLQMIINNLEEIKKTTYERSSDSYLYAAMSEQVFMKQAHLNELERRHAFLCNSLKSMRQELNLSFNKQPNSHLCFKVGDCNSNSCVKIQKKLNTLKEKCDTMRREQRQLLDYCSSNPVYLQTYADNYSNQYNDLLQIYADRIATMSDLCLEYKRMIKEKRTVLNEINSSNCLKRYDDSPKDLDIVCRDINFISSQLDQMNSKLQKEVDTIELAMENLKCMQQ